jgi:hypothetical protein
MVACAQNGHKGENSASGCRIPTSGGTAFFLSQLLEMSQPSRFRAGYSELGESLRALSTHLLRAGCAGSAPPSRLAGRTHAAGGEDSCTSSHRAPGRRGGLLSSAKTGLHHGGAELPLAALPGRDRPDRMGRRCSLLCGGEDADDARCEAWGGGGGPAQAARGSGGGAGIPAPPSTFVPVAIRRGQRILSAVKSQPAADRSVSEFLPEGLEFRIRLS